MMSKKEDYNIFAELGYKDQADYEERRVKPLKEYYAKQARITEIQNKAILEGLTNAEKEEYKKLKGGE
jgi:hypothetical protein